MSLPHNKDSGRDILYVNCVPSLFDQGWIYVNSGSTSSIVKMYSSSKVELTSPLDPRLITLLNHYFLQRKYVFQYHVAKSSPYDENDMILSIFSFFSTVVSNRFVSKSLLGSEAVKFSPSATPFYLYLT